MQAANPEGFAAVLTVALRPQWELNPSRKSPPPTSGDPFEAGKTEATASTGPADSTPSLASSGGKATPVPVPPDGTGVAALSRELTRARAERRWVDADAIEGELAELRAASAAPSWTSRSVVARRAAHDAGALGCTVYLSQREASAPAAPVSTATRTRFFRRTSWPTF